MSKYFRLLRVIQWIKNSFVFVPLVFSRNLFDYELASLSVLAFISFCLISSTVYIINDINDIEADSSHPVKKLRPIASGEISISTALIIAAVLMILNGFIFLQLNSYFIISALVFFLINIFYTFSFKYVVILDIFSIAAGFVMRVIAGAVAIDVEISSWLMLTTMFLSLFLAVMKRRSELEIVKVEDIQKTRKVLQNYSIAFIDQMATVAAAGVIICYALYTVSDRTVFIFQTEYLIYTTPFVVYGIFRYMFLVINNQKGENTSEIMMTDLSLIVTLFLYFITTIAIVYHVL